MQNTLIVTAATAAMAAIGFVSGVGTVEVGHALLSEAPIRQLVLHDLRFDGTDIVQRVGPSEDSHADGIRAVWAASIKRGERIICGPGTGSGNYIGATTRLTPAEWTGDNDCSEIQPGDVATATWEYRRSDGLIVSVSGELKYQPDADQIVENTGTKKND